MNPKLDPDKPEYPTSEQMEEVFKGYLKGGKTGIRVALDRLHPRQQTKEERKA